MSFIKKLCRGWDYVHKPSNVIPVKEQYLPPSSLRSEVHEPRSTPVRPAALGQPGWKDELDQVRRAWREETPDNFSADQLSRLPGLCVSDGTLLNPRPSLPSGNFPADVPMVSMLPTVTQDSEESGQRCSVPSRRGLDTLRHRSWWWPQGSSERPPQDRYHHPKEFSNKPGGNFYHTPPEVQIQNLKSSMILFIVRKS